MLSKVEGDPMAPFSRATPSICRGRMLLLFLDYFILLLICTL